MVDSGPGDPAAPDPRGPGAAEERGRPYGRGWVACGAAGSALVAAGAFGVGALPRAGGVQQGWLGVDLLRDSSGGRATATALAATGVLLLLLAWARLPHHLAGRAAVAWSLPLLLAPPVFSRDVYAYAAQGALLDAGLDPYEVGPAARPGALLDSVAAQYADTPSPYGPVFLLLARAAGDRVVPAVLLLRLLAVAGLLLAAWALRRSGGALWLGVANPLVVLHGVGGAHNETLMAGLLLTGLSTRRAWLAAVLVTLGGLVKVPALAGLAVLPVRDDRVPPPARRATGRRADARTAAVVGLAAGATAVLVTVVSGVAPGWLRTSVQGVAGPNLLSPAYGLGRALGAVDPVTTVGTALGLTVAAVLLLAAPRLGRERALGWALVAVAALAPAVQPWYLLWGLLPLAVVAGRRTRNALAAASAVLCLAVLPSGVPLLQGPTWGVPVLLAAGLALLAGRAPRRSRRPRTPGGPAAPLA